MTGKRKPFFGSLAAICLTLLYACSLLPGNLEDGVIALNVGTTGQFRALEVHDYDVESLDLEILAPDPDIPGEEVSIWSAHWVAPNSQRYMIQGIGPGTYRIVVTHNGVDGDETLSVTEDETFMVAPMKITTINVVPGLLGVLDVEGDDTDPVDLTGPWTCTWNLINGTVVTPMYFSIVQTGDAIAFSFGATGTLDGSELTIEPALIDLGYIEGSLVVDSTGNGLSGPFSITETIGGPPVILDFMPEWGEITGEMVLVRTDPALLGSLTVDGWLDWEQMNWDAEPPVVIDSGTMLVDVDTAGAMAMFDISDEGPWESLDIAYTDGENDIALWFNFEPSLEVGSYPISSSPPSGSSAWIDGRCILDGVGFDEAVIVMEAECSITAWDGSHVTGSITKMGESEPVIAFDLPIAPSSVW